LTIDIDNVHQLLLDRRTKTIARTIEHAVSI